MHMTALCDPELTPAEIVTNLLVRPERLYSRAEVLAESSPVPAIRGIYAWHFRKLPPSVPSECRNDKGNGTLLYVGISPHSAASTQNLRKRITYHYRGNAYGSTLRLTLGVLLAAESGLPLRRVGSGLRCTFTHTGEQWLDRWMAENAFVAWHPHPEPWLIEAELLRLIRCPLNIADNKHEPFTAALSQLRRKAKEEAVKLPIADETEQTRRAAD